MTTQAWSLPASHGELTVRSGHSPCEARTSTMLTKSPLARHWTPPVSQLPEPIDPRNVRASDTDRHQVADRLRDAAAEGRLTLDELEERLEGVYGAKTYAELEPYTYDLPEQGTSG